MKFFYYSNNSTNGQTGSRDSTKMKRVGLVTARMGDRLSTETAVGKWNEKGCVCA